MKNKKIKKNKKKVGFNNKSPIVDREKDKKIKELISKLGNESGEVRGYAAESLVNMGDPMVPYLTKALGDENEKVRGHAAWVIGEIGIFAS